MRDQFTEHLRSLYARPQVSDRYVDYNIAQAQQRLLRLEGAGTRAVAKAGGNGTVADLPEPGPETAVPAPGRSTWLDPHLDQPADADEARKALNAIALRTVFGVRTAEVLRALISEGPSDAAGALAFACLLHLLGHEGSQFWWQFAAAAGDPTAAYCLFLEHSRHGEYNDAQAWAEQLDARTFPQRWWGSYGELRRRKPLPPTLLMHVADYDDDLLGVIAVPDPALPYAVHEIVEPQVPAYVARHADGPEETPALPDGVEPDRLGLPSDWPWLVLPGPEAPQPAEGSDALRRARRAEEVVKILEQHPGGATHAQIARETGIPDTQLEGILRMLVEEEFARVIAPGRVYAPGPALTRLGSPTGTSLQLQHTLALARDSVGAAVYLGRYVDGEVHITQMADGPVTPAVNEWVDFRSAAHASAVGKCLLTQLDQTMRADHLTRHKAARLTHRTITSPRILFDRLKQITLNDPVFDLREYSPHTVCSAVPITVGSEAGSLALSLPYGSAHRLEEATQVLARKAVPVLLTLLLAGAALPSQGPDESELGPAGGRISQATFERMRRCFRTPVAAASTIRQPIPSSGPHLAAEPANDALYLFPPEPEPPSFYLEEAQLALPHAYAAPSNIDFNQHHRTLTSTSAFLEPLLVFQT